MGKNLDSGIRAEVLAQIVELAKKSDIQKIILFGSRARGDYRERSDIDLAVMGAALMCLLSMWRRRLLRF